MRRFKQQLQHSEVIQIIQRATNGVLSLVDADGNPYGVPMSFVYDGYSCLYFHCARVGRKIECIRNNPRCCFTVIDKDEIHPEEFTTYFRSVIVEGTISILSDKGEVIDALRLFTARRRVDLLSCAGVCEKAPRPVAENCRVKILKF